MENKLLVPDIGDFEKVEIIEILVKTGDKIKKNDSIVTLESDKSSVEVPSISEGVVENINVKIGDKVSKGDLLLQLKENTLTEKKSRKIESEKILNSELDRSESKIVSSSGIATAYYFLGNYDKTFRYLNFAIEEKDTWLTYNLYRYNFDKISNDGRFKDIKNIMNLPAKP